MALPDSSFDDNFASIPILDFSLAHDPSTKPAFLDSLSNAITNIGFLYAKNLPIPSSQIEALVSLLPPLFSISAEEKISIDLESSPHFLGFSALGNETTGGVSDQREQFEFGYPEQVVHLNNGNSPSDHDDLVHTHLIGPNRYPLSIPEARDTIQTYMSSLTTTAQTFLTLVAESLSLPPDSLHHFTERAQNRLKIIRYPPSSDGTPSQGVGPHKDSSGWWTFLLQASPPHIKGLQVLNKAGQWIDVPNIPGTFVVNIGQAFEVLTHGACKATTHRVVGGTEARYSVAFFLGMRGDLTKEGALKAFMQWYERRQDKGLESSEGAQVDSAFLRGKYDTWGESQLRTKVRSHRKAGRRFYGDVFEKYINDDM